MQQQQIHCTKITTVQNEHLFMTVQSFLVFWPLNDQITVSFVRAAGVLAKGRMFDMPVVDNNTFSKMCISKSLTGYTDYGGYGNRNAHFLVIMKSNIMNSLCCLF